MISVDYRLVDADNHYYEADDCFTRHLESTYRDKAIRPQRLDPQGDRIVRVGGRMNRFIERFISDSVSPPGSLVDFFRRDVRDFCKGDPATTMQRNATSKFDASERPEFVNHDARLALMDQQGVEAAILFPSQGVIVEPQLREQNTPPREVYAHLRAFNRWLEDDWGYAYENRIFAAPLLSLYDRDLAITELDRVLAEGARVLHLHAMPGEHDRSPADPIFDGFWGRIEDADVPVAIHVGDQYKYLADTERWGENPCAPAAAYSAFQIYAAFGDRPIMDMLAALVLHNLFGRFPGLRVMSVEYGVGWVSYLMSRLDKAYKQAYVRRSEAFPLRFNEPPADVFRRHVFLTTFVEEDGGDLVELLGPTQVLLGSDFPHPEGTAAPLDMLEEFSSLPADQLRMVARDNAAGLLGLTG